MNRLVSLATLSLVAACKSSTPAPTADAPKATAPIAVTFAAKSGSTLAGTASFTDTGAGVVVKVEVSGISPGKHGIHVHENPDCSADDGASAGGHYNPHGKAHALPTDGGHIGDLGNLEAGEDGKATLEITITGANLKEGDSSSYRGRAVIIHEKADDGGQPTGNAGGRIGCAEIR